MSSCLLGGEPTFAGGCPEEVRAWHLHAVLCAWLEGHGDGADHRAQRKPFSVSPPAAGPERGLWQHGESDLPSPVGLPIAETLGRLRLWRYPGTVPDPDPWILQG